MRSLLQTHGRHEYEHYCFACDDKKVIGLHEVTIPYWLHNAQQLRRRPHVSVCFPFSPKTPSGEGKHWPYVRHAGSISAQQGREMGLFDRRLMAHRVTGAQSVC